MNFEEFETIKNRRIELINKVLSTKGKEYSPNEDRLHNFKRAAEMLNTTPENALIGMWTKHIISILDIVNNIDKEKPSNALLEEKIGDAINYLILLEALIKERSKIILEQIHTTNYDEDEYNEV